MSRLPPESSAAVVGARGVFPATADTANNAPGGRRVTDGGPSPDFVHSDE